MKEGIADAENRYVINPTGHLTQSWGQPPIGLYVPIGSGQESRWQPLTGVESCSSAQFLTYGGKDINQEAAAWDAASDEAFVNFERSL